jgi:hypothetical protein
MNCITPSLELHIASSVGKGVARRYSLGIKFELLGDGAKAKLDLRSPRLFDSRFPKMFRLAGGEHNFGFRVIISECVRFIRDTRLRACHALITVTLIIEDNCLV